jgi:LemA protein
MFFELLEQLFSTNNILWYVIPVLIYFVMLYNSLVTVKHNATKAFANIEVLLKQRHDELPKLIAICKQYMAHEKLTLEQIIIARSRVEKASKTKDIGTLGQAESSLRNGLDRLFALSEAYPDLKADQQFKHIQNRVSGLENSIADRREFYNEAVNVYNIRIEQIPEVIVAKLLNFQPLRSLEFAAEELSDIDIDAQFASR